MTAKVIGVVVNLYQLDKLLLLMLKTINETVYMVQWASWIVYICTYCNMSILHTVYLLSWVSHACCDLL